MPAVDQGRTGALVAGASGALLMASMFLPWFGLDVRVDLPGDAGSATVEEARVNAFEAFRVIDIVLFVSAALGRRSRGSLAGSPRLLQTRCSRTPWR